jgi:ribose transport system ATP-binding protein
MGRIIGMMVGRVIYEEPKLHSMTPRDAPEVLRVENLSAPGVRDVSFSLRKGEILGFAGLMGAGRTETMKLIFGANPRTGGRIFLRGREAAIHSPKDAVENGIGYLSEDRKALGLATGLSVANNVTMADLARFASRGIVNEKSIVAESLRYVEKMDIRTPSVAQLVSNLSGGNQQKVVVAKWLLRDCEILIIDEPTRGIDIGAKSEIYKLMSQLVEEGKSIIMISSELPELLRMSDRIAVMCEGRKTGELDISEATQEKIMRLATARGTTAANDM